MLSRSPTAVAKHGWSSLLEAAGGAERLRVIGLLSAVLALNSADLGTVGAVAAELERSLHIDDLQVGLAASAVALAAAAATLPIGWLTDRVPRVPLMAGSIVLWSVAMIATGASTSFAMLLGSRVFLGAVQATSGPTLAALTGDFFPERERSKIFGFIHAGELLGAGFGFVVSGEVAAILSWRWSFWLLTVPGLVLAVVLWRALPEPDRVSERIQEGEGEQDGDVVHELVQRQHVKPDPELVLRSDPDEMSVREAATYLLRIPTNVILIAAMSLVYFFLAGAQTFGVIYVRGHFGLGQAAATAGAATLGLGALAGVIVAGRLADGILARGRLDARIAVSAAGFIAAAILFVPPIVTTSLALALPLFMLAAAAITAPTAPLDAALLDVIPPAMWGRAEGLQTAARTLTMALAPILFGWMAQLFAGRRAHGLNQGAIAGSSAGGSQGLEATFLIMLVPILLAGVALLWARSRYARDVATMEASPATP